MVKSVHIKRFGTRFQWTLALLMLAAVLAAAYTYFIGTQRILAQAEAFAFRRMTVPQLAQQGSFRFFYATNRAPIDAPAALEQGFASRRQPALSYGTFDTRIEPSLGLGMLLDASDWFLNEEIRLQALNRLTRRAYVQRLREQVAQSPRRSLLLVVHGFREAFPSAWSRWAAVKQSDKHTRVSILCTSSDAGVFDPNKF